MRIATLQLNPTVGDLRHNVDRLIAAHEDAGSQGAELTIAPELAVPGYPPRDLLLDPSFVRATLAATHTLVEELRGPPMIVGTVVSAEGEPLQPCGRVSNGALVVQDGRILACHRKLLLPAYDVFDESRYFVPGTEPTVVNLCGQRIGITVCEDIWNDKSYWTPPRYERDPVAETMLLAPDLLVNISASPFERGKPDERRKMLQALARRRVVPVVYVNQVGGNDSLIFDGRSMAFDGKGELCFSAKSFAEAVELFTVDGPKVVGTLSHEPFSWEADVTDALCLGLADYVRKCGFKQVVLGLSGGIDSALTAALAVRALGADAVTGVALPSRYSSQGSLDDAQALAELLRIRFDIVSIDDVFQSSLDTLTPVFDGAPKGLTEENLQARIRGLLLMAYSNREGSLLLTTGNKSEVAVGYATLYGDMCGGLAMIADLYKMQVYALAHYLNRITDPAPIPQSSLTKAPSAELRPNQTDQDSLPPYPELDAVLAALVDEQNDVDAIVARGFDRTLVERVLGMLNRSEYKRRQAAPGLKVSRKAFGEGRRLPIAARLGSH